MSDAKKLSDCIDEYRKSNKKLDDKLTKIEEEHRQIRRALEEQQPRPA